MPGKPHLSGPRSTEQNGGVHIPKPGIAGSSPAGIASKIGRLCEIEIPEKSH
jgi:hypothetical protein